MTKQTHLFNNNQGNQDYVAKGPIFDSNPYSGKRYLLVVAIVVVVGISGFFGIKNWSRPPSPVSQPTTISQVVTTNDSQTKLARRALATYLEQHQDITLSNAQKLFIETTLAKTHKGARLQVGTTVEYTISELEVLIEKSQNLTTIQLQAWTALARGVKF